MIFDKNNCISLIYDLARSRDIKIGQLEENAGLSKGYLARALNGDSTFSPPASSLVSIASQLGVTVDFLLNGIERDKLTSNEQYILNFVETLRNETLNGKIDWKTHSSINRLFGQIRTTWSNIKDNDKSSAEYLYYKIISCNDNKFNQVVGDIFSVSLPNTEDVIYITKVLNDIVINDENFNIDNYGDDIDYQLLINQGCKTSIICSTVMLNDKLKQAIIELYYLIRENNSKIELNKDIRNSIDSFMKTTDANNEINLTNGIVVKRGLGKSFKKIFGESD